MSEAQQGGSAAPATAGPQLTNADVQRAVERLRSQQNFVAGLFAGAVAALVGAVIWAVITDVTGYQIGFMAIGVGFIVGYAVRVAGKGIDQSFAIMGAVLALLGCVVGNALAVLGIVANQENMRYSELWSRIDLPTMGNLMAATFSPMDLLFYAIAIYEGYKLSFRQVTDDELQAAARGMI
jgi:phosphate/sulfate permease